MIYVYHLQFCTYLNYKNLQMLHSELDQYTLQENLNETL